MPLDRPPRTEALPKALAVLGGLAIAFILGAWVAHRDVFPYREALRRAFDGAAALATAYLPRPGGWKTDVWTADPRPGGAGVTVPDAGLASPGETLVTVGQYAHLIALDGTVLHTWHYDFRAIARERTRPERLFWRPARALPGGDLLVIVDEYESPSGGHALLRLDRDSRVLWAFHGKVHHDFDVAPDGRVLVLGKRVIPEPPEGLRTLRGPLLDELVLELSPDGRLLRQISITEAFAGSPYAHLARRPWQGRPSPIGDYLHSNNLDVVTAAVAARLPAAREGQVLLSLRLIDTIALMDLGRPAITWARSDGWRMQHDPDFLDDGRILLFDNRGDADRGGRSRVIEYDPATRAVAWEYPGPRPGASLQTSYRGDQQRLPNGNTLITEFHKGRLLEVTPAGETAWELRSDFADPADPARWGRIFYAERYPPGTLAFEHNDGRLRATPPGGRG